MTTIKELDGGRDIQLEARLGSVFMEGRGFCYEFDQSIFLTGVAKAVSDGADLQAAIMYPPKRAFSGEPRFDSPDRTLFLFA